MTYKHVYITVWDICTGPRFPKIIVVIFSVIFRTNVFHLLPNYKETEKQQIFVHMYGVYMHFRGISMIIHTRCFKVTLLKRHTKPIALEQWCSSLPCHCYDMGLILHSRSEIRRGVKAPAKLQSDTTILTEWNHNLAPFKLGGDASYCLVKRGPAE